MRIFILCIAVWLAGAACACAAPVKLLALGDSYTIGQGVEEKDRWPLQLMTLLSAEGFKGKSVDIIARTGWTTTDLLEALRFLEISDNYDCVLVLIGANDQFRRRPLKDFEWDLDNLYRRAVRYAGDHADRVIAVSIPDWGLSPRAKDRDRAAIAEEVDAFNRSAQMTAKNVGIRWVDITEASRQVKGPSDFVADGLHPTAAVYAGWVKIIAPDVKDVLSQPKVQENSAL